MNWAVLLPIYKFVSSVCSNCCKKKRLRKRFRDNFNSILAEICSLREEINQCLSPKPLLKKIKIAYLNCDFYERRGSDLFYQIDKDNKLDSCCKKLEVFKALCEEHNQCYEEFIWAYRAAGLSERDIVNYDPEKLSAFESVKLPWKKVVNSTNQLREQCLQVVPVLENTLEVLKQ